MSYETLIKRKKPPNFNSTKVENIKSQLGVREFQTEVNFKVGGKTEDTDFHIETVCILIFLKNVVLQCLKENIGKKAE